MIATNQSFTGSESAWMEWQSSPGGSWDLVVARAGFKTADLSGYSNLVLAVNSPTTIPALNLPGIRLESSPPDVRTLAVALATFLPGGVDADPKTWQRVVIPLGAFPSSPGFSSTKVKAVIFQQGAPDANSRTLWVDNIRVVAGDTRTANVVIPTVPKNVLVRTGDRSVIAHWDTSDTGPPSRYHLDRRTGLEGAWVRLTAVPVSIPSFADCEVVNGQSYSYRVRAVNSAEQESDASESASGTPQAFANDTEFLEYLQAAAFDYFWYEANPTSGLVRDRSDPLADCSIAAVGFGLSAMGIGVDHGWITREQGRERVLAALRTLWERPQGEAVSGTSGYKGWFYHFLDMQTGLRSGTAELSSIDTAMLLAGILDARQFFDGNDPNETAVRRLADQIVSRVDWLWMANGGNSLTHGWRPESGFIPNRWTGYNEGMILYLLGLGAATNPLPAVHWQTWTSSYHWQTNHGLSFVGFPALFGHQYSHCWVDFRQIADATMQGRGLTYFENSRRATLAQRRYAMENPLGRTGYSSNVWGFTASDGPGIAPYLAYGARGPAPAAPDDGTVAPTAVGGSLAFAPDVAIPALRHLYDQFRTNLWTGYGFRDAFNLQANWWGPHVLGIDQGPILLMAENLRSGRVWNRMMRNDVIQRGLDQAGFQSRSFGPDESCTKPEGSSP